LASLARDYGHQRVAEQVRRALEAARQAIAAGRPVPGTDDIVAAVMAAAQATWQVELRPVINATGVVIHTNLGRAPLSDEAIAAMGRAARGYSNLEFDLESGERGTRHAHVEGLLRELTGAEAALVVNNNASAVLLGLSALARGKEVIVSRGQAVEIGGGFRIPDVLAQSGARLAEVGTTNRTYLQDYDDAITHETCALLRVHTSNFRVIGFTHTVSLGELVDLARRRDLLVLDDLGSGCLLDTTPYGLLAEPTVQASISAGADLAFFSGDKLLGGPQAGIIVGREALLDRVKRHPLARAVRIDKVSLAGLAATLVHYLRGEAADRIPVWRMIGASLPDLRTRAETWAGGLGRTARIVEGRSMIGGGSLPEEGLPTWLLAIAEEDLPAGVSLQGFAARLRTRTSAIVARVERGNIVLDPRTVLPGEDGQLVRALQEALSLRDRDPGGAEGEESVMPPRGVTEHAEPERGGRQPRSIRGRAGGPTNPGEGVFSKQSRREAGRFLQTRTR